MEKLSIIIPTYNGLRHLKELLPLNLERINESNVELIICDDYSTDGTMDYLNNICHPKLKYMSNTHTKGVSGARNCAVSVSEGTYLLFIDNDFLLNKEAIKRIQPYLNEDIFAVACCINQYDNRTTQQDGVKLLLWKRGQLRFTKNVFNTQLTINKIYSSCGVQGACFATPKSKFMELEGFDELLFSPYLLEETDFYYRGAKRDWKVVYNPDCMGYHKVGGTIDSKNNPYTKFLSYRNSFLFTWKNIHSKKLLIYHVLWIPIMVLKPARFKALINALKLFRVLIALRRKEIAFSCVSDDALLKKSQSILQSNDV